MDKNSNALPGGPKVSQIANLFQRKTSYEEKEEQAAAVNVMRTDSHAARFNNARALFERLGEGRINQAAKFSIKLPHSSSKEDNLKDLSPERNRSPSPKKKHIAISNGGGKLDPSRIQNVSRLKGEKPEKPEKPERKFNSKELIEKQKNWTSHFPKTRNAGGNLNRCDIIRAVPTGIVRNNELPPASTTATTVLPPTASSKLNNNKTIESPPSPSIRQSICPPEIKPRSTSRSNSLTSPVKSLPNIPQEHHTKPAQEPSGEKPEKPEKLEKPRKKSLDFNEPLSHAGLRRHSNDSKDASLASPAHAISTSTSPGATGSGTSSGPSSPIHTEDEKQENESNEKTDLTAEELQPKDAGEQNIFLN